MQSQLSQTLLQVNASEPFIPVVTSFAESTAIALGLGKTEALDLMLAAEEVFYHLCRVVLPEGGLVAILCSGGGYYVRLDFTFPSSDFDMRAFNITAAVSLSDEAGIEQMGLLLASRSVDRFKVVREPGRGLKLTLLKEKTYASLEAAPTAGPAKPLEQFIVRAPDSEELKLIARLLDLYYENQPLPDFFSYPGKLVDMVQGGELKSGAAVGPSGEIGGAVFWRWMGTRAVECFGPYLFNQKPDSPISDALLESCIGAIAKTSAVVLINQFPTSELPREQFEYLGSALACAKDGTRTRREAWARLLREDLGSAVWVHPRLADFVEREYSRLVLPREIRQVKDQGEQRSPHSVLLTTFDRLRGSVRIDPISYGKDFESNLVQHLELFRQEGILDVFFVMDLGQSWQAELTSGLLRQGFGPCLLLPYAGTGDHVVFQLQEAAS